MKVRAVNAVGPGGPTAAVSVTLAVPPTAPGAVAASAAASSITVQWSAPSGGAAVTGYTVIASPGPATCATTGATTCVLGAVAGTTYTITVVAHSLSGDSPASAPSAGVTPSAPAVSATVPATPLSLTTDRGAITTAAPGQQITVLGTGFAAHSTATVTAYSEPVTLGSVVTDAAGSFALLITLPADLATGTHDVVALGAAPSGAPRAMKLTVTVAAPAGVGLPVTGAPAVQLALAGLATLIAGVVLMQPARAMWPVSFAGRAGPAPRRSPGPRNRRAGSGRPARGRPRRRR